MTTNTNCISIVGTPQRDDKVVFGATEKYRYVWGGVSEDGRF